MTSIISGYRYLPEGPALQLDAWQKGTTGRSSVPVRGQPLTLVWGDGRYCVGYRELSARTSGPCPGQATLTGKLRACWSCEQRTGFNPSFYNVEQSALSQQQLAYNRKPHVVYLAAFAVGVAKVGISSEWRVSHRLREQGARRALILARCADAYEARAHEAAIHEALYLPEQVRSSRKLALLNERFEARATEAYLCELRQRAERELALTSLDAPILEFDRQYLGGHALDLPIVDLSQVAAATPAISGLGVGMIGDILIVGEGDRQLALSLKSFIGRVVEISDEVRPNAVRPALQMGFAF